MRRPADQDDDGDVVTAWGIAYGWDSEPLDFSLPRSWSDGKGFQEFECATRKYSNKRDPRPSTEAERAEFYRRRASKPAAQ